MAIPYPNNVPLFAAVELQLSYSAKNTERQSYINVGQRFPLLCAKTVLYLGCEKVRTKA